jgi:Protein of unknown function (DUF3866)
MRPRRQHALVVVAAGFALAFVLKLRRAKVLRAGPGAGPEQELTVELDDGQRRPAVADVALLGASEAGDEVIVNVQALDLGLGSGGFDVVHVNLTRGLHGEGRAGAHVMKLNYTSLQHAVSPVEESGGTDGLAPELRTPVAVLALHGQLAPVAWAFGQVAPGRRLGFVQTPGGALSGGHSRVVRTLRERGLLAGHITAGAAYGAEQEAISVAGALDHGAGALGWDAAVCGPGPGIVGSDSLLGHGGMQALDSTHTALALKAPTLLVPRMSSADERPRHRGISHHSRTVLGLLLGAVVVALPSDASAPDGFDRHEWRRMQADLEGYGESGLPAVTMGRTLAQDPLFFAAALAGGAALAEMLS